MDKKSKIGLSLSGGGYRAAAFHLGVLKKLHEMGILDRLDVLSTISGGSIAGAYYLLNKEDFEKFVSTFEKKIQTSTVSKVILSFRFLIVAIPLLVLLLYIFIQYNFNLTSFLLNFAIIALCLVFLFSILPLSDLVEKAYQKIFFGKKKLTDFPAKPLIAINATNLESGRLFTFSRDKMGDSFYTDYNNFSRPILFKVLEMPVSVAVSASTAVPYPFNPIKIHKNHYSNPNVSEEINPSLVDGGVYDNQGIHKLTTINSSYRCDYIICSDASAPFTRKFFQINPLPILTRVNHLMMNRVKNLQSIQNVYNNVTGLVKEIAFFSINWNYENCLTGFVNNLKNGNVRESIIKSHSIPKEYYENPNDFKYNEINSYLSKKINFEIIIKNGVNTYEIGYISKIKTGLSTLTPTEIDLLTRHAAVLTEIQLRLYCPSIVE